MDESYIKALDEFWNDTTSILPVKIDRLKEIDSNYLSNWGIQTRPLLAQAVNVDDSELVNEVLRRGPDVNLRYDRKNPVTKKISKQRTAAMEAKSGLVLRSLIIAGADLTARCGEGISVFAYMAIQQKPELLEMLLVYGGVAPKNVIETLIEDNARALRQDAKTGGSISKVALARKAQLHGMRIVLEKCSEVAK